MLLSVYGERYIKEKLEITKGLIINLESKDRQYNG
jgi:hypothetical protein